jgi:hypothetical protein
LLPKAENLIKSLRDAKEQKVKSPQGRALKFYAKNAAFERQIMSENEFLEKK